MRQRVFKVFTLCLALFMAFALFVACNLVVKDQLRDNSLVVATITVDQQKQRPEDGNAVFPAQNIGIYKYDLYQEFDANGQSLIDSGSTYQEAVNESLDNVIERELVFMDIAKQWTFGEIVWDKKDTGQVDDNGQVVWEVDYTNYNDVLEQLYKDIDNRIFDITNQILTERGEPTLGKPDDSATAPTFPVPPSPEDDDKPAESQLWQPLSFPGDSDDGTGNLTDPNKFASLQREAFRRYIAELERAIDDEFRAGDSLKEEYHRQIDNIKSTMQQTPIKDAYKNAYLQFGKDLFDAMQNGTNIVEKGEQSILWYSLARSTFRSSLLTLLQDKLKETARDNVSDARITKYYNDTVDNQMRNYTDDADDSAFATVADSTSGVILYNPTSRFYWVKHILIEFSQTQKDFLEAIKTGVLSDQQYISQRDRLVGQIVTHPIENGEENTNINVNVNSITNEVQSIMSPLLGNGYEADAAFNQLIYKYNRDKSMAEKLDRGYLVKPASSTNPDKDGIDSQYMIEFSRAARDLKRQYDKDKLIGRVEYCVTDYGVHLVYLSNVTEGGRTLKLSDYTTAAKTKTVYQAIKDILATQDEATIYTNWQNNAIIQFQNQFSDAITKFESRYKDMWKSK